VTCPGATNTIHWINIRFRTWSTDGENVSGYLSSRF